MFEYSKSLGIAAIITALSAILHFLAPLVSGFSSEGLMLVPFGIAYAVIAYFVAPNRRWLAWISFLILMFTGIAALSGFMGTSDVPSWNYFLILMANWSAATLLFIYLWLDKPKAA